MFLAFLIHWFGFNYTFIIIIIILITFTVNFIVNSFTLVLDYHLLFNSYFINFNFSYFKWDYSITIMVSYINFILINLDFKEITSLNWVTIDLLIIIN